MNPFLTSMQVLSGLLQVYILILMIRIFLTWVTAETAHPVFRVLMAVTDPWLNLFRRLRLSVGGLDFSPLVAIGLLVVAQGLALRLAREGAITVGIVLSALVGQAWALVSGVIFLVGVVALVRLLAIQFRWGASNVWHFVDALLQPLAYNLNRLLRRDAFFPYTFTLMVVVALALVLVLGGSIAFGLLGALLDSLPV